MFFTSVMRQYPFPEFAGEKFITECVVWDKMAAEGYYLRFYNVITYLCQYREDGLTMAGLDLFYRNPQGYGYTLRLARQYKKYPKKLSDYFDAVSDGNNITNSKPDPEVFLKAADMLGVSYSECMIVEDADAGVEAGKRGYPH